MRPRSMTGFGRGTASADGRTWTVEIKTVNHRFLDQRVVLPRPFGPFEEPVKKEVAGYFHRGRVEVTVSLQGALSSGPQLAVNEQLAAEYHKCLKQLVDTHNLEAGITLTDMLSLRDIISQEEQSPDMEIEWGLLKESLTLALQECTYMREKEGQALKEDMFERLDQFGTVVDEINKNIPQILQQRQDDLKLRVDKLLSGVDIDPIRLSQEMAIMVDKSDVTEEVVRLDSHMTQFRSFLESDEPVGRRLDFLLQEFLREVNTLNSKISNSHTAHLGVEMKNEIEQIREQVQNIE